MNRDKINNMIKEYEKFLESHENDNYGIEERKRKIQFYQNYDKNRILNMDEDDLEIFIKNLWASQVFGNTRYLVDKMIDSNNGLKNLTKLISNFVYGKDSITKRWDFFYNNAKFFGPSYMSELLGYIFPDDYALANNQVLTALQYLEYKNLPKYNYQFTGKKYIQICNYVKDVQEILIESGVRADNLLAVDYFLWEVAQSKKIIDIKEPQQDKHKIDTTNRIESKNIHKDMIDKLLEIGTMLGFETRSEVKVALGSVVDTVWEANIGNMGRVIYVFEVQSKGSIKSLMINLQKAKNNKGVQGIVVVTDHDQIEIIKNEAEGLQNLVDLKYWEFNEVIDTHENLSKASKNINNLGLVPETY